MTRHEKQLLFLKVISDEGKSMIETIHISQKAKDQLIKLKRITKIQNWNILCRWGFCTSLAEATIPPPADIPSDSNVEMTWKVFGGPYADVYWGLVKERCHKDGLGTDEDTLAQQFRLHLHRGLAYLAADKSITNISGLLRTVPLDAIPECDERG